MFFKNEDGSIKVFQGDCREVLKDFFDESIDAVVCDPPYHLQSVVKRFGKPGSASAKFGTDGVFQRSSAGFMGQSWDGGDVAFQPDTWREVYRVMKPGAYLLAFGGTRTFHRMACAIEDAGFEIRDCVMWMYGCLDDKTECLTSTGWKPYTDISVDDLVLQWDSQTGNLSWVNPQQIMVYPYDGEMVRLKNRHTDQSLTPNHRVYAKVNRHSRNPRTENYEVNVASDLRTHWQIDLPMAGFLREGDSIDPAYAYLVGWWLTDAWAHKDGRAIMFSQCKPHTLAKLRDALMPHCFSEYIKHGKLPQHADEHTFYVHGPIADRLLAEFPDRRLPVSVLRWGEAARKALLEGLLVSFISRR